ncbi:MAG: 7-cyano-7-deazaguanine synthase [Methanomicrobia archaeon]|nr:7-cyano-7-deazaguanine synthase [Methanomicrobia archaeon]
MEVKNKKMFYPEKFVEEQVKTIREQIRYGKVVVAVSGGVESSVCAVLSHRAIGDQLVAVLIDDGLMRKGERENIMNFFTDCGVNIRQVDATREFFDACKGVNEPEEQRRVYRNAFYAVLGRIVQEEKAHYLIKGTTAADVVKTEDGIEVQDNIFEEVGLIDSRNNGLTVVEPLRELYKHEVSRVAKSLGVPSELTDRATFPVVLDLLRENLVK